MNTQIIQRFERYLKSWKKVSNNTFRNYMYEVRAFDLFINKDLLETNEEDIKEFLLKGKKEGNGASRINFKISALSCFFEYVRKNTEMKNNPMKNIKREKVIKKEITYLNRNQINETRKKLEEHGDTQLEVFFGLLICSSPTKDILINLKWSKINWKKKYIYLEIDEEERGILYLDDYTIEKLKQLKKERKDKGLKRGNIFLTRYNGLGEVCVETLSYWVTKIKQMMNFEELNFSVFKKTNQHYLKTIRRFSDEKIKRINDHKSFPKDLRYVIIEEIDDILNMK